MKFKSINICLFLATFLSACKEGEIEYSDNLCKSNPAFISKLGFSSQSFLTTSENKIMGLLLKETTEQGNPAAPLLKQYQHPSWSAAGWLAPILIAPTGDVYTAPAPLVNILNNPIGNNNTIYKVDNVTGEMAVWLRLPLSDSINPENPYGILAMAYLCDADVLYVASIAGSTRKQIKGKIYAIDTEKKKIIDELPGFDPYAVGISYITGDRKLYFGDSRSSLVREISLSKNGSFKGKPSIAFSLEGLGIRGDDKAKKIRPDNGGSLVINGVEFNHNLIAPTEKQESVYVFSYDPDTKFWSQTK